MNSSAAPIDLPWLVYTNSRTDYRVVARHGKPSPQIDAWISRLAVLVDPSIKPGFETIVGVVSSPDATSSNEPKWLAFRVFDAGTFLNRPHTLAIVAFEVPPTNKRNWTIAALLAALPRPIPDSEEYDSPTHVSDIDLEKLPRSLQDLALWERTLPDRRAFLNGSLGGLKKGENGPQLRVVGQLPIVISSPPESIGSLDSLQAKLKMITQTPPEKRLSTRVKRFMTGVAVFVVVLLSILEITSDTSGCRPVPSQSHFEGTLTVQGNDAKQKIAIKLSENGVDLPSILSIESISRAAASAATDAENRLQQLYSELNERPHSTTEAAAILHHHLLAWERPLDASHTSVVGNRSVEDSLATLQLYRRLAEELRLLDKQNSQSPDFQRQLKSLESALKN